MDTWPKEECNSKAINSCLRYPNNIQIALLAYKILEGIRFLEINRWTHRSIKCSAILLSYNNVQLTNVKKCYPGKHSNENNKDTKALSYVLATTIDKGLEIRDVLSVQSLERWTDEAIDFVSKTAFASSNELRDHSFLTSYQPLETSLIQLIEFAKILASQPYSSA
ncbi:hypothetical protein P280DRAFT_481397 [Massarina eburnea CBS 473.64]|uniref:Protein kinase domain-containing protein n=1 Tax=Massarina eburnea CBS 473.64 TaxID=1395130 RepID=A0A6A6RWV3_9PLEO|nr:hypothetical protein P280DRAFT_481397 [Massarina eburnea CBS 473.64]